MTQILHSKTYYFEVEPDVYMLSRKKRYVDDLSELRKNFGRNLIWCNLHVNVCYPGSGGCVTAPDDRYVLDGLSFLCNEIDVIYQATGGVFRVIYDRQEDRLSISNENLLL